MAARWPPPAPRRSEVRKADHVINLIHKSQRDKTQNDHARRRNQRRLRRTLPDIRFWFMKDNGMRGVQMVVQGADGGRCRIAAKAAIGDEAPALPLANVVSTAALDRPEIRIRPAPASRRRSRRDHRCDVRGDPRRHHRRCRPQSRRFNAGDRLVPIRVQLEERARAICSVLETLRVTTARAVSVPLAAVADIEFGQGPTSIDRYDRVRRVAVEADLVGTTALGEAVDAIKALPRPKACRRGDAEGIRRCRGDGRGVRRLRHRRWAPG
jgi:multidrug efflux pump subunit AcrB